MSEVSASDEQDVILNVDDLAERYGISPLTVYKWNSQGTGPAFFKAGGAKYKLADVRAWEESKRVQGKREAS